MATQFAGKIIAVGLAVSLAVNGVAAEIGCFSRADSLSMPRYQQAAAAVGTKVFISGGKGRDGAYLNSWDLYEGERNAFHGIRVEKRARTNHFVFGMPDGRVLILGGESNDVWQDKEVSVGVSQLIERFDPSTRRFDIVGVLPRGMKQNGELESEWHGFSAVPIEGGNAIYLPVDCAAVPTRPFVTNQELVFALVPTSQDSNK